LGTLLDLGAMLVGLLVQIIVGALVLGALDSLGALDVLAIGLGLGLTFWRVGKVVINRLLVWVGAGVVGLNVLAIGLGVPCVSG